MGIVDSKSSMVDSIAQAHPSCRCV
jgi:hypothetical protein